MRKVFSLSVALLTLTSLPTLNAESGLLDLETALERVYSHSPLLRAAALETDLSGARTVQAGVLPNPELEIDLDKFGGSNGYREFDSTEITYSITQLIELGGKRGARVQVAEQEELASQLQLEQTRYDLRKDLIQAFITAYAAQEQLRLAKEKQEESQKVYETVKGKVDAGKVPVTQQLKVEIALVRAKHDVEHASHQFVAAKYAIAALWGDSSCLDFTQVAYPFYALSPPPSLKGLCFSLDQNPDLNLLDQEICSAESNIALQEANQVPDLLLNAGVVNIRETNDYAGTVGIVIPIPVFDRNQANIDISYYELLLAQERRDLRQHELEIGLQLAYQEWNCSYHEALSLRDSVLNKATESFKYIKEGYVQGKYEFLELLDAQRTLIDIQEEYINSLIHYHLQKAEVERILGKCL
jgi:outer membrane protein, heavy metal efflux system